MIVLLIIDGNSDIGAHVGTIWFKLSYAIFMFTGIHAIDTKKFYELRGFYLALEIFPIIK